MSSIEKEADSSEKIFDFDPEVEYSRMKKGLEELGEEGYLFKKEENVPDPERNKHSNICTIRGKIDDEEIVMRREKRFSGGELEYIEIGFGGNVFNCFASYYPRDMIYYGDDHVGLKKRFEKYEPIAYDVNKDELLHTYPTAQDFEEAFMNEKERYVTERRCERLAKMRQGLKDLKSTKLGDQSSVDEDYAYCKESLHEKGGETELKVKINGKEIEAYKSSDIDEEGDYIVRYNMREDGKKIRVEGENVQRLVEDFFDTYKGFAYHLYGEYGEIEEINRERNNQLLEQKGGIDRRSTHQQREDIIKWFFGEDISKWKP